MTTMYKTVHGDGSVQYTIQPQVDQLHVNEMSSILASPIMRAYRSSVEKRWLLKARIIVFIIYLMANALVIFITHELCGNCILQTFTGGDCCDNKDEIQGNKDSATTIITSTTSPSSTLEDLRILGAKKTSGLLSMISTSSSIISEEDQSNFESTTSETVSPSTPKTQSTLFSSTEPERTWSAAPSYSSLADVGSSASEESPDSRASIISVAPTNSIVNKLRKLKIPERPSVKFNFTITDTIPQMYLKTGIDISKKDEITTNVLSQGHASTKIIFKTPDGTIDPGQQKWPFDCEDTATLRQIWALAGDVTILQYFMLTMIAVILIILAIPMPRLSSAEMEEILRENRDDVHSASLDA